MSGHYVGVCERLIELLKKHEGLSLRLYEDTSTPPRLTIGYGRNIEQRGILPDEAELMLRNDVFSVTRECGVFPWYKSLSENRKIVVLSMVFNLGIVRFMGFKKLVAALELKDYATASREMLDSNWHRQLPLRSLELATVMLTGELS